MYIYTYFIYIYIYRYNLCLYKGLWRPKISMLPSDCLGPETQSSVQDSEVVEGRLRTPSQCAAALGRKHRLHWSFMPCHCLKMLVLLGCFRYATRAQCLSACKTGSVHC